MVEKRQETYTGADVSAIRTVLRMAHIPISEREYLRIRFSIIIIATLTVLIAVILLSVFEPAHASRIILLILILAAAGMLTVLYPYSVILGRKIAIDTALPHAIAFMEASLPENTLFLCIRRIFERSDLFGEVSEEFGLIVRDVEVFGDDLLTAVGNLVRITPSQSLREAGIDLELIIRNGEDPKTVIAARSGHYRKRAAEDLIADMRLLRSLSVISLILFMGFPLVLLYWLFDESAAFFFFIPLVTGAILIGASLLILLLATLASPRPAKILRFAVTGQHPLGTAGNEGRSPLAVALLTGGGFAGMGIILYGFGVIPAVLPVYPLEIGICLIFFIFMLPPVLVYETGMSRQTRMARELPDLLVGVRERTEMGMPHMLAMFHGFQDRYATFSCMMPEQPGSQGDILEAFRQCCIKTDFVGLKRVIALVFSLPNTPSKVREILQIATTDARSLRSLLNTRDAMGLNSVALVYATYAGFLLLVYIFAMLNAYPAGTTDAVLFRYALAVAGTAGLITGPAANRALVSGFKHTAIFLGACCVVFGIVL